MKKYLLCIYCCFFCCLLNAQPASTGNWLSYFGNKTFSKKWNWHHEVQYRNYNLAGDLEQLLLRTGIGYNLTENNNNLLLGYGFIYSEPYIGETDIKRSTREHRIYQQFITRQSFGRVGIQHRYRIEERILEEDFKMRFRYFLSINVPVNFQKIQPGAFYLSGYNEIFLNGKNPVFDRNRIYGGLGYVINKNFRTELGFMTQLLPTSNRNQLQLMLFGNY